MFVVGFATEAEIELLKKEDWEVEDAAAFVTVVDTTVGSLMLPPEPSPSNTKAVVVFVDASVYEILRPRNLLAGDSHLDLEYKTKRLNAPEQHPPTAAAAQEPICTCRSRYSKSLRRHEYFCPVALKERGQPYTLLNITDWRTEQIRIQDEIRKLEKLLDDHKFRCSHKRTDGADVRYPVGGGDTWCEICRQKFD